MGLRPIIDPIGNVLTFAAFKLTFLVSYAEKHVLGGLRNARGSTQALLRIKHCIDKELRQWMDGVTSIVNPKRVNSLHTVPLLQIHTCRLLIYLIDNQ